MHHPLALAVLVIGSTVACGGGDQLLGGRLDDGSAGPGGSSGMGGGPIAPDASGDRFCAGSGSPVAIPTPRGDKCSGDVANQAFRFALCTCTELGWVGGMTTDSFNSATGQKGANGAVGVDGYVVAAQGYHVGGSFWIAGQPAGGPGLSVATTAPSEIAKELHVGGGVAGQGVQAVHGDVFSGGNITCPGMNIDGAIHVPPGTAVIGATAVKGIVNEPVSVPKPCDCKSPQVDIAAVVDLSNKTNDDAGSGISPAELGGFVGSKTIDLMCGRYYFEQISGPDLTIRLQGRTLIAVGGDVVIAGRFLFELSPGAELDLFVRGNMNLTGATTFGSTAEPAKIRVYVAGASVFLPGTSVGADIYAPAALIGSNGSLEMSGALFADRFSLGGSVTIHYDEAIAGGRGCPELPDASP